SALLRQQQRNEIMKTAFRFVNPFFSLTARKSCRLRKPPVPAAAFAARTSETSNGEGGES
ncbi:hypothetical protein, partial [Paraburkholderia heleia]